MFKFLSVLSLCAALYGCTSGVEIINQGDVYSSSGAYNCYAAYGGIKNSPCTFTTADAVDEWFSAIPRQNFVFAGWRNCPSPSGNSCHVQLSQETVEAHYGETWPNLVALFAPNGSVPVKAESCKVGPNMSWDYYCRPHIGQVMFINRDVRNSGYPDYEVSYIQIVGFDNITYTGGFGGMFWLDMNDTSFGGMLVVGPNHITGDVAIRKTSKTYPCQGLKGCEVSIAAVAL